METSANDDNDHKDVEVIITVTSITIIIQSRRSENLDTHTAPRPVGWHL